MQHMTCGAGTLYTSLFILVVPVSASCKAVELCMFFFHKYNT